MPSSDFSPQKKAQSKEKTAAIDTSGYHITPMFEQYLNVKAEYPDALLFYRMGDFYELFFEDATTAARELQLALTSRNRESENPIPMCGVPWHAVEAYTSQLVEKGYNIAICDQIEDPRQAKGLVKRAVTRIITPGTVTEDSNLEAKQHNYIGALVCQGQEAGFVWADVSTGQWTGLEGERSFVWQQVGKYNPRELIIPEDLQVDTQNEGFALHLVRRNKASFESNQATKRILQAQKVAELGALGLEQHTLLVRAAGGLLSYFAQTQKRDPDHLLPFRPTDPGKFMIIDDITERNLELFTRLNGSRGRGTLRYVLDASVTPMGGRYLEDMLRNPLRDPIAIATIHDTVGFLLQRHTQRDALREALSTVFDLERLSTRISLNRALPKDFLSLRTSLLSLPKVRSILEQLVDTEEADPQLKALLQTWDDLAPLAKTLSQALQDPAPTTITEGGIFKAGYNKDLDHLLELSEHGEKLLQKQLERDQQRLGGIKLKLGNNRVFGYYYELTKSQQIKELPADFVRRQTLVNAERYTTAALQKLEQEIVQASEARKSLEYKLFQDIRQMVAQARDQLLQIAQRLAKLDYWQALAHAARRYGWNRPTIVPEPIIRIQEGRHPVVEDMLGRANFVPNSVVLDRARRLCLLTGPNMAGKSTILRQVALICIMAQMGSFVPAESAEIGVVDRLFSRVGAADNLAQGQSTFMVEMMETARILRQASKRSLIILDELGRGTSTYDGLAIAWAVAENLAQRFGGSLRTLFATHYHELTQLERQLPGVFTMNIAIREFNKRIVFLHKLVPGPADRSYGVEVARLAGVPQDVVTRADDLLNRFESMREASAKALRSLSPGLLPGLSAKKKDEEEALLPPPPAKESTPREHPLRQILKDIDPENLTPLAALNLIGEWKRLWGQDESTPSLPQRKPQGD